MVSTPSTSAARPDTVIPKSTSPCPVSCRSTSPQATCITVPSVTPAARARSVSAAVRAALSLRTTRSGTTVPRARGATSVGPSIPESASAQASRDHSWSTSPSQSR